MRRLLSFVGGLLFVGALPACSSGGLPADGGAADGSGNDAPMTDSSSSDSGLTDAQVCANYCSDIMACGFQHTSSCATKCLADSAGLACLRAATTCNAIALCTYAAFAPAGVCTSGKGVPSGTATCKATEACIVGCENKGWQCACNCWSSLDPAKAALLFAEESCGDVSCGTYCDPPVTGCATCVNTKCAAQSSACSSG